MPDTLVAPVKSKSFTNQPLSLKGTKQKEFGSCFPLTRLVAAAMADLDELDPGDDPRVVDEVGGVIWKGGGNGAAGLGDGKLAAASVVEIGSCVTISNRFERG